MEEKITLKLISKAKRFQIDGFGSVPRGGEITVNKSQAYQLLRSGDFEKVKAKFLGKKESSGGSK